MVKSYPYAIYIYRANIVSQMKRRLSSHAYVSVDPPSSPSSSFAHCSYHTRRSILTFFSASDYWQVVHCMLIDLVKFENFGCAFLELQEVLGKQEKPCLMSSVASCMTNMPTVLSWPISTLFGLGSSQSSVCMWYLQSCCVLDYSLNR